MSPVSRSIPAQCFSGRDLSLCSCWAELELGALIINRIMKNWSSLSPVLQKNSFRLSVLNLKPLLLVRSSQVTLTLQGPGGLENTLSSKNGIGHKAKTTVKGHDSTCLATARLPLQASQPIREVPGKTSCSWNFCAHHSCVQATQLQSLRLRPSFTLRMAV